jgi:hypothetical protein
MPPGARCRGHRGNAGAGDADAPPWLLTLVRAQHVAGVDGRADACGDATSDRRNAVMLAAQMHRGCNDRHRRGGSPGAKPGFG